MSDASGARDAAMQELLDKQAIREVTMRYCRGVDRGDAEMVSSAYHPDAHDDHGNDQHYRGATIGQEMLPSLNERMASTNHQITTQTIEVYGDVASCESYSLGKHFMKNGRRLESLTRYLDRFERRDGEWRISHRKVVVESLELIKPGEHDRNPGSQGSRDRNDPSYALFQPS
jgi:ketosteroid isomerase-like protein